MCIEPYTRVANRSFELVEMDVKTVLTLGKIGERAVCGYHHLQSGEGSPGSCDFSDGLHTSMHMADSAFEVVRRNNRHNDTWTNPCRM